MESRVRAPGQGLKNLDYVARLRGMQKDHARTLFGASLRLAAV